MARSPRSVSAHLQLNLSAIHQRGISMDAQWTSFVLTIAALFAGTALAEPPSQSAPVRYSGNDWSSAGPTSAPTITASPNNRYAYPQNNYPQNTAPAASQPQSITGRTQRAIGETANALRDGFDTGVRAAGNSVRSTAQQSIGTAGYPAQASNPFATQPTAPTANSNTRNSAPPPWPAGSGTTAPPATPSWDLSIPATSVDRSVLTNPNTPASSGSWSSIGSTIAAPPLIMPQLPTAASTLTRFDTTPVDSGPAF